MAGVGRKHGPKVSHGNSPQIWQVTKLRCEVLAGGRVRVVHRGCDSEAWAADEDIPRFDVAMDNVAVVHVAHALEQGLADALIFCHVQKGALQLLNHVGQVRLVEREDEPEHTLHAEHVDVLMLGHRRIRGDFHKPPQIVAVFFSTT